MRIWYIQSIAGSRDRYSALYLYLTSSMLIHRPRWHGRGGWSVREARKLRCVVVDAADGAPSTVSRALLHVQAGSQIKT